MIFCLKLESGAETDGEDKKKKKKKDKVVIAEKTRRSKKRRRRRRRRKRGDFTTTDEDDSDLEVLLSFLYHLHFDLLIAYLPHLLTF